MKDYTCSKPKDICSACGETDEGKVFLYFPRTGNSYCLSCFSRAMANSASPTGQGNTL